VMGKVRASAGGQLHDPSGVQGSLVVKGTFIDEVGRTRDAGSNAIVMPGFRRIPPAADMTYVERLERHNAQLDAENQELHVAINSMRGAKKSLVTRVEDLEKDRVMMLEEVDRLRAALRIVSDESRDHEITSMFLKNDNSNLQGQINVISGQNAALAAGLVGTPMDPTAGKLWSTNSLSHEGSAMYDQQLARLQADVVVPALPTIPLERSKYPVSDRVVCLLAKVGVLPDQTMQWEQCAILQGAIDATAPEHQDKLEEMCKDLCGQGLGYPSAVEHFTKLSSASLARGEKTLGLTTVHYSPVVYDPIMVGS